MRPSWKETKKVPDESRNQIPGSFSELLGIPAFIVVTENSIGPEGEMRNWKTASDREAPQRIYRREPAGNRSAYKGAGRGDAELE